MKILKYIFPIFLVIFLSSFFFVRSIGFAVDKMVGVINSEPIFASEFEIITRKYDKMLISSLYDKFYFFSNNARGSLVIRLMEEKLFKKESNSFSISVTKEEAYPFFGNISIDSKIKIRYKNVLEYLVEYVRKQILKRNIFEHCVYSNIIVTDEEINKSYYGNSKLYEYNKKYYLCIIRNNFYSRKNGYKECGCDFVLTMKLANSLEKSKKTYSLDDLMFLCNKYDSTFDIEYFGSFSIKELSNNFKLELIGLFNGMCSTIIKEDVGLKFFYILDLDSLLSIDLCVLKRDINKNLILYKSSRELTNWLDFIKLSSSIEIIG